MTNLGIQKLLIKFIATIFLLCSPYVAVADVGDIEKIAAICRGGAGTLVTTERGTIEFNNSEVKVEGQRVFVSDSAGNFTQEIQINFQEYQGCIERLSEKLLGMLTDEDQSLLESAILTCSQGKKEPSLQVFEELKARYPNIGAVEGELKDCVAQLNTRVNINFALHKRPGAFVEGYEDQEFRAGVTVKIGRKYCGLASNWNINGDIAYDCDSIKVGWNRYRLENITVENDRYEYIVHRGWCEGNFEVLPRVTSYSIILCLRDRVYCKIAPTDVVLYGKDGSGVSFSAQDCLKD